MTTETEVTYADVARGRRVAGGKWREFLAGIEPGTVSVVPWGDNRKAQRTSVYHFANLMGLKGHFSASLLGNSVYVARLLPGDMREKGN
jgi:hypothetical protein